MRTWYLKYDPVGHIAYVAEKSNNLPAGMTSLGSFTTPTDDVDRDGLRHPDVPLTIYHKVRDALYALGIRDMSMITITLVLPTLGALTLDSATAVKGTFKTIKILGASYDSRIIGKNVPVGMVVNSTDRTITGTPTNIGSAPMELTEIKAGAVGSPRKTTGLAVVVSGALGPLTLKSTSGKVGVEKTWYIQGASNGSVITASALPAGLTLNSNGRTIKGTPTTAGTTNVVLTETLAGATGSPKVNTAIPMVIAA